MWIHLMQAVELTLHQVMRCQSPDGTYTIYTRGDQGEAKKCYSAALKYREKVVEEPVICNEQQLKGYLPTYMKQTKEEDDKPRTKVEELVEEILNEKMIERKVLVGAPLQKNEKKKLVEFLKVIKMYLHSPINICLEQT